MYIYMPGGAMRRISSVGWNSGSSSAKANASCRLACFFCFGVIPNKRYQGATKALSITPYYMPGGDIKALLMRC